MRIRKRTLDARLYVESLSALREKRCFSTLRSDPAQEVSDLSDTSMEGFPQ